MQFDMKSRKDKNNEQKLVFEFSLLWGVGWFAE